MIAALELQGFNVAVLATTGSAAKLIRGQTVHKFFAIDVNNKCWLEKGRRDFANVASTDVFIIDEISMMSSTLLELIDTQLRNMGKDDKQFGGKSILLVGDLFQLPAVIPKKSAGTTLPVYESRLWKAFQQLQLIENCRQKGDLVYAELLNRVRIGEHTKEDIALLSTRICQKLDSVGKDSPGHIEPSCTMSAYSEGGIICSTHDQRNQVNEAMFNTLAGQVYEFEAHDTDSNGQPLNAGDVKYINGSKGSLPKTLKLKIGAIVILTRNLNVDTGLVNGTRATVSNINQRRGLIEIQIRDSHSETTRKEYIHRIKQKFTYAQSGIDLYRVQFPLILGWAMTVHRVQGMTLPYAQIYLDETFFENGQAYVALSRVTSLNSLHLISFDAKAIKTSEKVKALYKIESSLSATVPNPASKASNTSNPASKASNSALKASNTSIPASKASNTSNPASKASNPASKASNASNPAPNSCQNSEWRMVARDLASKFGNRFLAEGLPEEDRTELMNYMGNRNLRICFGLRDEYRIQSPEHPEIQMDNVVQMHWLWRDLKGIVFPAYAVGNGNCFYYSLSIFLTGSPSHYWEIRAKVAEMIVAELQVILSLAGSLFGEPGGIGGGFRKAVTDHEWAGALHILAAATWLKREIWVYTGNTGNHNYCSPPANGFEGTAYRPPVIEDGAEPIVLLHCSGATTRTRIDSLNHFVPLLRATNSTHRWIRPRHFIDHRNT